MIKMRRGPVAWPHFLLRCVRGELPAADFTDNYEKFLDLIPTISFIFSLENPYRRSHILNISELESRTGITKQNIRFYEKRGLLSPERNVQNNYREYTDADVRTLQVIKVLRKLDVPIHEIHHILTGETALPAAMEAQLAKLQEKQRELDASIDVCKSLLHTELCTLDADRVLKRMEKLEEKGGIFMSIVDDYRKVAKAQAKKSFSFTPDTMVQSPREFTDALFQYADENKLDLIIKKESMYPVFEINGVEYTAERTFRQARPPVAYIVCTMTRPEEADAEDEDVPETRKTVMRLFNKYMAVIIMFFVILLVNPGLFRYWWWWAMFIALAPIICRLWRIK